jgi:hypothetical protein
MVFAQEFLVHSLMLKIGSKYFRTFLDSPDKVAAPATAIIKYDYATVVDEDGESWSLEAVQKVSGISQAVAQARIEITTTLVQLKVGDEVVFKGSDLGKSHKTGSFYQLLCCLYNRPFCLRSYNQLTELVKLADFYLALPALSACLDGVLHRSRYLCRQIPLKATDFLKVAYRVRNKLLYKQCMTHVAGQSGSDNTTVPGKIGGHEDYPILEALVYKERAYVLERVNATQIELSKLASKLQDSEEGIDGIDSIDGQAVMLIIANRMQNHLKA